MNCPNFASNRIGAELISSPPLSYCTLWPSHLHNIKYPKEKSSSHITVFWIMVQYCFVKDSSAITSISHFFTVMISGTFLICICGDPFQCFLDIFSPNQCFQTKQTIKKLLSSLEKLSKTKFDDLFAMFIKDWTVLCNLDHNRGTIYYWHG